MRLKNIIFTGGGSGGHVLPSLTLIEDLSQFNQLKISYIGGNGIEKSLITRQQIKFREISTGKLRRYFSMQNAVDILNILLGFFQALEELLNYDRSRTLVFSTGGYVSVPVVIAAKVLGCKIYIHEQTSRVGLANKICAKFADKIFISFAASKKYFPEHKTFYSGYPVRKSCYGDVIKLDARFQNKKPLFFATGGGNGSLTINEFVKNNFKDLVQKYFVVHQVGKKFIDEFENYKNASYLPLDFVGDEIISLFKKAELVISRAGAGTVCELIAIGKKSVYVPLKIAQKNEQFHNAEEAVEKTGSIIIEEDLLKTIKLDELVKRLGHSASVIREGHKHSPTNFIIKEILAFPF